MRWLMRLFRQREIDELERRLFEEETRQIWLIVRIAQMRKAAEKELARAKEAGEESPFAERMLRLAQEAVGE